MKETYVKLVTIIDIQEFVSAVNTINGEIDLISGRYTVDGKSIMGIFSLDLRKPIKVVTDDANYDELVKKLGKFIVEA